MEIIVVGAIIFWIVKSLFSGSSKPDVTVSLYAGHESTPEEDAREERRRQAEEKDRQRTFRIGMAELNTDIGMKEAVCPSCGVVLAEFPKRKTKCKDCGNFIYKRTRPWDGIPVLFAENQLEEFEKLIEKYYFIKEHCILNYPYYEAELRKEKGVETVNFNDVVLYKYKRDAFDCFRTKDFNFFCINLNKLVVLCADMGDYLNALKYGMMNGYYEFSHINICEFFYDTKKEIEEERKKRIFCCQDSRWGLFMEKLGYSYNDVKKIFYSMDFDTKIFTADQDEVWKKCILGGLKKYKND